MKPDERQNVITSAC